MTGDVAGNNSYGHRVDHEVRVPQRVNVALRAIEARGNLQHLDAIRRHNTSRRSGRDLRVARVLEQRWQPSELQLGATFDERVSPIERHDVTRLRIDVVRILGWFGQRYDTDLVSADFPRH